MSSDIVVHQLRHAICVPFGIRTAREGERAKFDDIVTHLKSSKHWKQGHAPPVAEEIAANWSPRYHAYQRSAYFHPFVRRFMNDPSQTSRFHRADKSHLLVTLSVWSPASSSHEAREVRLNIGRCELALFRPDIAILLLEVQPAPDALELPVAELLFDTLRRLYPPYFDRFPLNDKKDAKVVVGQQWLSGHCPVRVRLHASDPNDQAVVGEYREASTKPKAASTPLFDGYADKLLGTDEEAHLGSYCLAAHWAALLAPFTDQDAKAPFRALLLGDDRAPIMNWLTVGEPRAIARGDWVRLCFADDPGSSTLPYAKPFLRDFESRFCYDRFFYCGVETPGPPGTESDGTKPVVIDSAVDPSRIVNSGYAFSYVGTSDDDFFCSPTNGALATFRHIYVEMGLIAHFQRAALLNKSLRLSKLVHKRHGRIILPDQREVRDFYDHFVAFTQNFWFDEISPQEQGRELFEMWREQLRIQPLYNEVRQELKDLVEYTELRAGERLNRSILWLGGLGLILAVLSVAATVYTIPKEGWADVSGWPGIALLLASGACLVVAFGFLALRWFKGDFGNKRM